MNVVLFEPSECTRGRVRLAGRRHAHIQDVLKARVGDELVVGQLAGRLGRGTIVGIDADAVELAIELTEDPPPALPVDLVLALPRPPSLRKVLQQTTALGVKRIALIGSSRVEKSYWQSSVLRADQLAHQLKLGLEQARDTLPPRVELHRHFRSFATAVLPELAKDGRLLLGQPGAPTPRSVGGRDVLIIGPEGGFVPEEVEQLLGAGASPVGLSARPLRVETAVVALLGALSGSG